MVHFDISNNRGKTLVMEAVVLPKVTTDLPSCLIPFDRKSKHLSNIRLADPDFGTPRSIDLLLELTSLAVQCFTASGLALCDHYLLLKPTSVGCLLVPPTPVVTTVD